MNAVPVDLNTRSVERFSPASYSATRSSLPSNVTSATANFARERLKERGPLVSQVESENVSPSAFASRRVIFRLWSPTGSCSSAICDLPGPLKAPLAATLVPKTPTERTSARGRGVGLGVGLGVADPTAAEGSGLPGGRTAEHAVSATTARASSLTAERPADRFRATLRYTRTCHATFFKWITDVVVLCRGPELNWRHMVLQTIALPTELPRRDFPGNLQLTTTGSEPNAMVRYTIIPFRGRRVP